MALRDLIKAVNARWDDQSVGETVTGGIHRTRVKDATAPYVIYSTVGAVRQWSATSGSANQVMVTAVQFQLTLVHNGGAAAAGTMIATIKAAFLNAPLSLDAGTHLSCRYVNEIDMPDPLDPGNPNAVLWTLVFDAEYSEVKEVSPS